MTKILARLVVAAVLALGLSGLAHKAAEAATLAFEWSFEIGAGSTTGIGGTVSGTIIGLQEGDNDGTGLTVTVDTSPVAALLGGGWTFMGSVSAPAFTVTGGAVVDADAYFKRGDQDLFMGGYGVSWFPQLRYNMMAIDLKNEFGQTLFSAIPYVPLPAGFPLALSALAALAVFGRRRRV